MAEESAQLLHRVQDLLLRKPNFYDVVFYVGENKTEVKAVRALLAASPVIETKMELWEHLMVHDGPGKGIPLPDVDPEAFDIFVKLTMFAKWTPDTLKKLGLTTSQALNLIAICREFQMTSAQQILEKMLPTLYWHDLDASLMSSETKSISTPLNLPIKNGDRRQFSTLSLVQEFCIKECPPFVCEGHLHYNGIATKRKILVHGVGFLGPIEDDAIYDVEVFFTRSTDNVPYEGRTTKKRVCAEKGKVFYVMLDEPITLNKCRGEWWNKSYGIFYNLKGPDTKSCHRFPGYESFVRHNKNEFCVSWGSDQIAEILYTNA